MPVSQLSFKISLPNSSRALNKPHIGALPETLLVIRVPWAITAQHTHRDARAIVPAANYLCYKWDSLHTIASTSILSCLFSLFSFP